MTDIHVANLGMTADKLMLVAVSAKGEECLPVLGLELSEDVVGTRLHTLRAVDGMLLALSP